MVYEGRSPIDCKGTVIWALILLVGYMVSNDGAMGEVNLKIGTTHEVAFHEGIYPGAGWPRG